jgi:hypothetical protein
MMKMPSGIKMIQQPVKINKPSPNKLPLSNNRSYLTRFSSREQLRIRIEWMRI